MSLILDGTNGETFPSWSTSGRPSSPATGQVGFNTTVSSLEAYNGSTWQQFTNGPAFSAYSSGSQALSNNTFTKIVFNAKTFDTNNNFDSTTNYRFTPTVAGYYQLNGSVGLAGTSSVTQFVIQLYKNGSNVNPRLIDMSPSASLSSNSYINLSFSTLVYLNGSTDYVELYAYVYGASATLNGSSTNGVVFQGSLVRAA